MGRVFVVPESIPLSCSPDPGPCDGFRNDDPAGSVRKTARDMPPKKGGFPRFQMSFSVCPEPSVSLAGCGGACTGWRFCSGFTQTRGAPCFQIAIRMMVVVAVSFDPRLGSPKRCCAIPGLGQTPPHELTTATASISIMKSGPARRVTPTVVLVGVATPK